MKIAKDILKSQLFRIGSLNSASVVIKICIGLITSKIIAVFVGPGGMALVGNLRNFIASVETVSTLGLQNGVVKYVAENEKNDAELHKILSTVFIGLGCVALILSGVLFLFSGFWSDVVFGSEFEYAFVFKALAIALPWYACSIIMISVINGLSRFRQVIYITIWGNVIGLVVSAVLIWKLQTLGALLSIIIAPSLLFFVAWYFITKEFRFANYVSFSGFSSDVLKNMGSYALMAFVSSVILPLVFLSIRNNVIEKIGAEQAGFWEAISRISLYYMMFVSTILVVYFLPKLVQAKSDLETKGIFYSYYKSIIPVFIAALVVLFFVRDFVIQILFTSEFSPVSGLFLWQLLGDVLKALSLILGYNLIAKKKTGFFIFSEIASMSVMFFASSYFILDYGIEGVVMAHFVTYLVYLLILAIYLRKSLF